MGCWGQTGLRCRCRRHHHRRESQQGQTGARLRFQDVLNNTRRYQRRIAIDDHQRAVEIGQRVFRRRRGMPGAELLLLDGAFAAHRMRVIAHALARGRSHHHHARHARGTQRRDHMAQQGLARDLV